MSTSTRLSALALAVGLAGGAALQSANAALVPYTSLTAFQTALTGAGLSPTLTTFESQTAGTALEGVTIDDILYSNFSVQATGIVGAVTSQNGASAVSPDNAIGTTNPDTGTEGQFENGDGFVMTFPESYAIGLWFITSTPVPPFEDDLFTLEVEGTVQGNAGDPVALNGGAGQTGGADGYFIGFLDLMNPFTEATVSSVVGGGVPVGAFQFRNDDVYRAEMPLPSTLALFGLGAGMAGFMRRRRRQADA